MCWLYRKMLAMKHLNVKNITIKVIKDHCKFTGTITAITPAATTTALSKATTTVYN